jgi:alpha-beta hydrolase superfamily lysophospholipase
MATFVFVHSPVASPATWAAVAELAAQAGHGAKCPALTDAIFDPIAGGAPYLRHCAAAVAQAARGCTPVILAAHSGAGLLAPAAAAALRDLPAGAIIVDGLMPQPGKSWFDTAPPALNARIRALAFDGRVAPWHEWWPPGAIRRLFTNDALYAQFAAETPRLSLAFFEEPTPPTPMPSIPCAYLRLSSACDADADAAAASGWRVRRIESHHLAMVTDPVLVWRELAALAEPMAAQAV